jgi:hypothetical protein
MVSSSCCFVLGLSDLLSSRFTCDFHLLVKKQSISWQFRLASAAPRTIDPHWTYLQLNQPQAVCMSTKYLCTSSLSLCQRIWCNFALSAFAFLHLSQHWGYRRLVSADSIWQEPISISLYNVLFSINLFPSELISTCLIWSESTSLMCMYKYLALLSLLFATSSR